MAGVDDVRVGRLFRTLRRRLGWRQSDVAGRAGVSQQEVSVIERGHLDAVPLRIVRAVARALDASLELDPRWRGGAIDRLLDERHALLVGGAVGTLRAAGWDVLVEVSYSVYGERGSIDVIGWKAAERALVVGEVKSELTSIEATLRKHDEKVRLAPRVVEERCGWVPRVVGRLLLLPDSSTSRRRLARALPLLGTSYPLGQREVRQWLARPTASSGGVLLLADTTPRSTRRRNRVDSGSGASPPRTAAPPAPSRHHAG